MPRPVFCPASRTKTHAHSVYRCEQKEVAVMECLSAEFESWSLAQPPERQNGIVLLDTVATGDRISMTMLLDSEHEFLLQCPTNYPSHSDNFFVNTSSSTAKLWCNALNEYVLDSPAPLTLHQILNKALDLYGSKLSISAAAISVDSDDMASDDEVDMGEDVVDDDDDDDDGCHMGMLSDDEAFTTEWELELARKKKRWAKKEESLRDQLERSQEGSSTATVRPTGEEAKQAKQIFSTNAASGILTNDLIKIIETEQEIGFSAEPVDDNIYCWNVKMFDFDPCSGLAADLKAVAQEFGYNHIQLELDFAIDLYPFYPPHVKVIRPRLQGAMMQRVTNMEILKLSFWNPTKNMSIVLTEIKTFLQQWARLEVESVRNNPSLHPSGAYIDIEHHLLRLALVSEVNPRANLQYAIEVQKAPKLKSKAIDQSDKEGKKPEYWKAGTGFGHHNRPGWDVNAYIAAQKERDKQIELVLSKILTEISSVYSYEGEEGRQDPGFRENVFEILEGSALVPFIEHYLNIESFLEIGRHASLYKAVLDIIAVLASHPLLIALLCPLANQRRSVYDLLSALKSQAASILKHLQGSAQHLSDEEQLAQSIVDLFNTVERAVATQGASYLLQLSSKPEAAQDKVVKKPMSLEERYKLHIKSLQFGSMEIKRHHYLSEAKAAYTPPHAQVFRIAQELSSLATSLPRELSTSVFVRTDDNQINFMKALITGPEDTPYSNGCFEFDIYFPSIYPKGPPKVNLQTTGGGTVRFNPNLYNCGKVCLSLLGTWEGQQGEKWNDTSTVLQVLVSIQSLILVMEPYFNEPGYEREIGTKEGDIHNQEYSAEVRVNTIRHAIIGQLRNPSPGFEDAIRMHFYLKKERVLKECESWLSDARKGSSKVYHSSAHERAMERAVADLRTELSKLKPPASLK
ncbi:baculoviral IAP repeat-containing protein 6-like isoform X2 [Corticium candelabrum]|uniref:baculoviral IAP repeat-containing protein 6-like isoform X2 n=1 Tax=Corticium candelabrum TaxID=121492 RepID=UPI002E272BD1|nr:baculoviral IAP repeat-containing protein 6-like isoform X2 [Corticium candelabrum]